MRNLKIFPKQFTFCNCRTESNSSGSPVKKGISHKMRKNLNFKHPVLSKPSYRKKSHQSFVWQGLRNWNEHCFPVLYPHGNRNISAFFSSIQLQEVLHHTVLLVALHCVWPEALALYTVPLFQIHFQTCEKSFFTNLHSH